MNVISPSKKPPSVSWDNRLRAKARNMLQRARLMQRNTYGIARPQWWPRQSRWRLGPAGKFDGKQVTIIAAGKQYDFTPAKYGRYRGHLYGGRIMADVESMSAHFAELGLPQRLAPLFVVVSRFEGGFDTIQTYDRAKFSWGFMQFALSGGLPRVLHKIKSDAPTIFHRTFVASGLDVENFSLIVQRNGVRVRAWQAANQLHDEPSLWKPFLLAAQEPSIRALQIQAAYENYYLGVLAQPIVLGGLSYPLGELFAEDERAIAVTFDRAVQRGVGYAAKLFQRAANKYNIQSPAEVPELLAGARALEIESRHRWDQVSLAVLESRSNSD